MWMSSVISQKEQAYVRVNTQLCFVILLLSNWITFHNEYENFQFDAFIMPFITLIILELKCLLFWSYIMWHSLKTFRKGSTLLSTLWYGSMWKYCTPAKCTTFWDFWHVMMKHFLLQVTLYINWLERRRQRWHLQCTSWSGHFLLHLHHCHSFLYGEHLRWFCYRHLPEWRRTRVQKLWTW